MVSLSSKSNESELVKKLQFDVTILMKKLSQYKSAEKGAKDIVQDYENMKKKYYRVLQDNEQHMDAIQESMD